MLALSVQYGKYGVQTTFYFMFEDATDAGAPFVGVAPLTADIWVVKDGGAPANATNGMTAIGNGIYSWVATATEMQAGILAVSVYDATATEIFKPAGIVVINRLNLGQISVDASQIGTNTNAVEATGNGTGHGMSLTGGDGAGGSGLKAIGGSAGGYGIWGAGVDAYSGGTFSGGSNGAGLVCSGGGGNNHGINALGIGTGSGINGEATASGGHGMRLLGHTAGNGLNATGGATNAEGASFTGTGSNVGIRSTGGATGEGAIFQAGGGNAHGLSLLGSGVRSGLICQGGADGPGARFIGGATSGPGMRIQTTDGSGIEIINLAGVGSAAYGIDILGANNGAAIRLRGHGTGAALDATGGATGAGIHAKGGATSGIGFHAQGNAGNSAGFKGTGVGTASGIEGAGASNDLITNLFETLEGSEPSGAIADNAKVMDILQYLKREKFGKCTVTASVKTMFKDDESTTLQTQSLSNDGTTVTRGVVA